MTDENEITDEMLDLFFERCEEATETTCAIFEHDSADLGHFAGNLAARTAVERGMSKVTLLKLIGDEYDDYSSFCDEEDKKCLN